MFLTDLSFLETKQLELESTENWDDDFQDAEEGPIAGPSELRPVSTGAFKFMNIFLRATG
jgi:hypothetical protein